ncbi:STAS/SEC14 domain-containing protein [Chloroflexota bacterium]
MEKPDREIKIRKTTLYLGEDNILRETFAGRMDGAQIEELREAAIKLRNMVDGKVNMLISIDKVEMIAPKVIEFAKATLADAKVGKVALIGKNPLAPILIAPFMGTTRKSDVAFFKTEEEAMQWLTIRH